MKSLSEQFYQNKQSHFAMALELVLGHCKKG